MSYCPRCGDERAYSADGHRMTINCPSCGEISVEIRGSLYPYLVDDLVFCPFCSNPIRRYRRGDCGEEILFCEICMDEFVLLDDSSNRLHICRDCPRREQFTRDMHSWIITCQRIRHICTACEVNPLASSVIRFLLDSKNIEKARSYKEIEEHTKDIPIIPVALPNVLKNFESFEYIQADDNGLWSITQKGIDHFFRVEEGE